MTYERAKTRLEHNESFDKAVSGDAEAIELAIEALEKQIPKKAYDIDKEMKSFDCPSCLSSLYAEDELENIGFCCVCGQAFDWSDAE